jgi:hypothetical protein
MRGWAMRQAIKITQKISLYGLKIETSCEASEVLNKE